LKAAADVDLEEGSTAYFFDDEMDFVYLEEI